MLKRLLLASAMLLPVGAQATPMNETDRTLLISKTMLTCTSDMYDYDRFKATRLVQIYSSFKVEEWLFRRWSQIDLSNYCGCYSATTAKNYTQEDINLLASSGKNPPDLQARVIDPAIDYCKKYLPLPDVSSIKNKTW